MSRIALQLYTVRRASAADFPGTVARVADLGFEGVELHALHGHSAAAVRELLDLHGLVACGRHAGLDAVETDLEALASELHALGTDRLVVAWIEPPRTAGDADAAAARLVAAAARAESLGLRLGFHNHDAEVGPLDDGRSLLDRLLEADTRLFLELDLGWAWYAGLDPISLLEATAGRAPLVHVKDMRRNGGPVHVPLGAGSVDYHALPGAATRAGVEWLVVEQDEADGDELAAVETSLSQLRSLVGAGS
ncbi:MAG TPA: sugar phosphate isomerase/epimerase [Gaiella sp.]|uniref:sugar phosphate isomerase/epimerase family protein n=1 Tax=Gaiella sp. TaxID=2663207 RepID=UPI002D7EE5A5|nr:sugar phosphate isomerase/epimerase [Gaiella sp.]HET9288360.1 sugar phosphate isomerase/epimerase [Gaiella sp.]